MKRRSSWPARPPERWEIAVSLASPKGLHVRALDDREGMAARTFDANRFADAIYEAQQTHAHLMLRIWEARLCR